MKIAMLPKKQIMLPSCSSQDGAICSKIKDLCKLLPFSFLHSLKNTFVSRYGRVKVMFWSFLVHLAARFLGTYPVYYELLILYDFATSFTLIGIYSTGAILGISKMN